jgi:O-acetyl-ADP-ribose deacetylase (regulator of RNase III)
MKLVKGDITTLSVDAVVNAANNRLRGGGGVDGAIHRASGPELLECCRLLMGCKSGDAKITPGFNLVAKYVIHTVAPRWMGGGLGEAAGLVSCYRSCMAIVRSHAIKSVAFPCLGVGAYRFPRECAAEIAVTIVQEELRSCGTQVDVTFCCFDEDNFAVYQRLLRASESR